MDDREMSTVVRLVELSGFRRNPAEGLATPVYWRLAVAQTVSSAVAHDRVGDLVEWALSGRRTRLSRLVTTNIIENSTWRKPQDCYRLLRRLVAVAHAEAAFQSWEYYRQRAHQLLAVLDGKCEDEKWLLLDLALTVTYALYDAARKESERGALYSGAVGCTEFKVFERPGRVYHLAAAVEPSTKRFLVGQTNRLWVAKEAVELHIDRLLAAGLRLKVFVESANFIRKWSIERV